MASSCSAVSSSLSSFYTSACEVSPASASGTWPSPEGSSGPAAPHWCRGLGQEWRPRRASPSPCRLWQSPVAWIVSLTGLSSRRKELGPAPGQNRTTAPGQALGQSRKRVPALGTGLRMKRAPELSMMIVPEMGLELGLGQNMLRGPALAVGWRMRKVMEQALDSSMKVVPEPALG